jgi:glycosyltransferase involved in cell wall biosynthesis
MLIAIPFYSNAVFLRETLLSVQGQLDRDFSVVVLDDSVDPREANHARIVVQECQEGRVRYHRNEKNLGLAGNWNQALELALAERQDFLVILHADDRLLPDYVRRVKQEFYGNPEAEAVFVKTRIINEKGRPVFSFPDFIKECIRPRGERIELRGSSGIGKLIPGDFIFCPTICYRVSAVGTRRFDPARRQVLDFDWVVRSLLSNGFWVGLYDQVLFEYRRHSRNTTKLQSQDLSRFIEEMEFYREMSVLLSGRGENALAAKAERMWIVRLNLGFEALKSFLSFHFTRAWRSIRLIFS